MIRQNLNLLLLVMNRKKNLIFFLVFILLQSCSFDNKTGIWTDEEKEKGKISKIENEQKSIINVVNVYSEDSIYSKEKITQISFI